MNRKPTNHRHTPQPFLSQEDQDALVEAFLVTMFLTIALISGFAILTL
jgi:hypothetical protein